MIQNSNDILNKASLEKRAICQFNINNLEWTKFILEECQNNNSPVILGVSYGAVKHFGGFKTVVQTIKGLIEDLNITIPVVIHLDHGSNFEMCKKAIDAGFTSVMIDASRLPLEENIKITKEVVNYAKKYNVSVEAEIGQLDNGVIYADALECLILVKETNIDSLAPSIGSSHGLYKEEPKINLDLIDEIKNKIKIPLVLHGGSGIDNKMIKKMIKKGINKININTELQVAWTNDLKKYLNEFPNIYDPRKIINAGEKNMKKIIKEKILLTMQ